ncbi:MAG TPA: sulfotransferase [Candidatus Binatia bacterium]|nr:sulfotransferase [Candidatus Binatia bacterium]
MRRLRVLITNNTLAARAGTELYVRDVALALLARGHTPIAYSTRLGEVAEELRAATVPVVDDLDAVTVPPDLIHGQHHLETMTALLRFPGVPAVSFCHGWIPWVETPLRFPRIRRYVAVDHLTRERLVFEAGIPEDRVRVVFNFVDLTRFKPRGPLPGQPRRALVFSNYAHDSTHLSAVRAACARAGIAIEVIGIASGNPHARPEDVLGDYDLVFAKARAAIEALAVGTAVILCDAGGLGPLVSSAELDRLRQLNFGVRTLSGRLTTEALEAEISRYDASDAAVVTRRIRAEASLDAAMDAIEGVYGEVLAEHAQAGVPDVAEEAAAAARYVRGLTSTLHGVRATSEHAVAVEAALGTLRSDYAAAQSERDRLRAAEAELVRMRATLGWQILRRYGLIKHRIVLPAYREIKSVASNWWGSGRRDTSTAESESAGKPVSPAEHPVQVRGVGDVLTPLVVLGLGRSGTTLLMQLLGTTARIVFDRTYPFEVRYLTYLLRWALLLGVEKRQPDEYWNAAVNLTQPDGRMGPFPYQAPQFWSGDALWPSSFIAAWQAFSRAAIASSGPADAAQRPLFYAEKVPSWVPSRLRAALPYKAIVLVRDPRDLFLSITAFDKQRGFPGFSRRADDSDWSFAERFVGTCRNHFAGMREEARAPHNIQVRYEDLALDLQGEAHRLGSWLGVSLDAPKVEAQAADFEHHMTSANRRESVARWRRELPADLNTLFVRELGEELSHYGYATE